MNTQNWPVELFKKAYRSVPAYRRLIQTQGIDLMDIKTMVDFKKLPLLDKKYLTDNPRRELYTNGQLPVSASCSSGSSGRPTYWFRSEEDDIAAALGYQHLITNVLNIRKEESVLALVCFAMGGWVAGTLTVDCLKQVALQDYQLTIFPAGIDKEDGLNALLHLGPEFDHILIYGYPPLLLDFVKEARQRGIPMGKKVKLIPAGDKNSEQWRETIAHLAGCPEEQVVSFYGSADALYMACETPLTHQIKKTALKHPELYEVLFGEIHPANMPGLYQYNEDWIFFEEVNGELALTIDRTLPLIRYNLRDRVRVIDNAFMCNLLQRLNIGGKPLQQLFEQWNQPFITVGSRSDVAVNYYGINIYYEHIRNITEAPILASMLSGNYFAYIENLYSESKQILHLEFELNTDIPVSPALSEQLQSTALQVLQETSTEFRKLHADLQHKASPQTKAVPFGKLNTNRAHTGIYATKGKKPRMINHQKQH